MAEPNLLLSLDETAETLRLSLRQIKAMTGDGRIPSLKIGRRRLVPRAALEQMIAEATVQPDAAA